jgi:hypothetical protein
MPLVMSLEQLRTLYSCMLLPLEAPESHAMSRQAKSVTLSEEERRRLARIDERGSEWRERRRARTVLLLDQGLSIDAVVAQQRIHRETVACPQGCLANSKLPGSARSAAQRCSLQAIGNSQAGALRVGQGGSLYGPSVEDPPVRRAGHTGIGVAGAERLEGEKLRLEENPAQSQKEAGRGKISGSPSRDSGIG